MDNVNISTDFIKLDQFLKWTGVADSGIDAKNIIIEGNVKVNGELELRRGKKLRKGDIIEVFEKSFIID